MKAGGSSEIFSFGSFRLDRLNGGLFRAEKTGFHAVTDIGSRALDVLETLIARRGELVSKDDIIAAVWPGTFVADANLTVQISRLRRILDCDRPDGSWIQTVPGRGYRFVGSVTTLATGTNVSHHIAAVTTSPDHSRRRAHVGRVAQLERFRHVLAASLRARRQTVFVSGEAGIGKTTFIEMATELLARNNLGVLSGHCTEFFGTNEAFLPIIDAVQEGCRGADCPRLLRLLHHHAPTWLAQMPSFLDASVRTAFKSEMFGATRERMLREFCDFVEALTAERPYALIIEDVHWSDLATLDVLSRLARGDKAAALLIVVSHRSDDIPTDRHPVAAMRQELGLHGRAIELALGRLSPHEVAQYLQERFHADAVTDALTEQIYRRTNGQPLFVVSLIDDLVAQRIIAEDRGNWLVQADIATLRLPLPGELKQMLGRHIDRLGETERTLLEVASAAGDEFSAALVASVVGQDILSVEDVFETLARKALILGSAGESEWPDGTFSASYAFQHALYQEVLYSRLSPTRKARTHRILAERLEQAYDKRAAEIATILALHFEEGRDVPKAMRYLAKAADNASKRFAIQEAANYLTRALRLVHRLPTEQQLQPRVMLLRQRSWARRSLGDLAGSVEDLNAMIAAAAEAGELRTEINGLLAVSRFCLHADRRQCLQATERALAKSNDLDSDDVFKALVQGTSASLNLYLKGWSDADSELCRASLARIADVEDHGVLIRRCGIEGILRCATSDYAGCRVAATQGKNLARVVGDVFIFVLFNVLEATALLHLGEWTDLRRGTIAAMAFAEKNANGPAIILCRLTLAWLHVEALDFKGAKRICQDVAHSILEDNPFAFYFQRAVLAKACLGLDDLDNTASCIHDVQRRIEQDGGNFDFTIYTQLHYCISDYSVAIGDLELARNAAARLHDYTAGAPDRNHLALAYNLRCKIAMAGGNVTAAEAELNTAIATLGLLDFPLAAWRIYLTATEFYTATGDVARATDYRDRYQATIQGLMADFEEDDVLRGSLSSAMARNLQRLTVPVG